MEHYYEEIDIVEYLKIIKKYKKLILVIIGITVAATSLLLASKSTPNRIAPVRSEFQVATLYSNLAWSEIRSCEEGVNEDSISHIFACRLIFLTIAEATHPKTREDMIKEAGYNPKQAQKISITIKEDSGNRVIMTTIDSDTEKALKIAKAVNEKVIKIHNKYFVEIKKYIDLYETSNQALEKTHKEIGETSKRIERLAYPETNAQAEALTALLKFKTSLRKDVHDLKDQLLSSSEFLVFADPYQVSEPQIISQPRQFLALPIIIISLFLGIVIGLVCAFFVEWWRKIGPKLHT